jgi:hypothetical protein
MGNHLPATFNAKLPFNNFVLIQFCMALKSFRVRFLTGKHSEQIPKLAINNAVSVFLWSRQTDGLNTPKSQNWHNAQFVLISGTEI